MPLKGFTSLCSKYAMQIVSKDKGNPQYHRAKNPAGAYVTHYKIDGNVIKAGSRCDYLLLNEESRMAYRDKTYTLREESTESGKRYFISFKDGQGEHHEIEVSEKLFLEFRQMERRNRNLQQWNRRHRC